LIDGLKLTAIYLTFFYNDLYQYAFVEVKARKNDKYGDPVDAITDSKIRNLVQAANAYIRYHRISFPIRFDVIVIIGEPGNQSVEHIEDAFYPPQY
jgi:putative endonuclease